MGLKGHRGNKYIAYKWDIRDIEAAYQWDFRDIEATNI
jgi:predicted heme/steroid binding protein